MSDKRRQIPPNPPRWAPNPDPSSIEVPGLDTSASTLDQIEQIEQLITIKLQNIDENFSKIQNVLADKLLPAVKRYAQGTEPVREAAKFWTSFYEQAAQIRIPSYDDYSTVNEMPSEREESETTTTQDQQESSDAEKSSQHEYEPSIASIVTTDNSFMPGQAAFSSTPATTRASATAQDSFVSQGSDPSWTPSLESPLIRLNREINNFSKEDEQSYAPSTSSQIPSMRYEEPTPNQRNESFLPRSDKGKGKDLSSAQPLLRNVLRNNLYSTSDISSPSKDISPLKFRGKIKTPIPKELNPYLPENTSPADWSGVVDLRDPSILTPPRQQSGRKKRPLSQHRTPAKESDEEESFDGLPPGMSPPVLMSPARPPRSSAELGLLKLGQTPLKEASARITRDLVRDIQIKSGGQSRHLYGYSNSGIESSMSTVPTPPSLSRYNYGTSDTSKSLAADPSFERMMARAGLNIPISSGSAGILSTPGLLIRPHATLVQQTPPPMDDHLQEEASWATPKEVATPIYIESQEDMHNDDSDSDDSMDEINNTAHPSAAFLMASQRRSDDSFGSSNHSSDSLSDEDANLGIAPVHPLFVNAVEDNGFDDDDSFDMYNNQVGGSDFQEETVFGVPPAERIRAAAAAQRQGEGLRMMGEDLLQDTIGIGERIALNGGVEESPTPAPWGGNR